VLSEFSAPGPAGRPHRLGVVVPAFNMTVEDEFAELKPPDVRHYVARVRMPDAPLLDDADQSRVVGHAHADLEAAIGSVCQARPDIVVLGISIPAFWDGHAGAARLRQRCTRAAGERPVIIASDAVDAAVAAQVAAQGPGTVWGAVTPYRPDANRRVAQFLAELNVNLVGIESVEPPTNFSIAEVTQARTEQAVRGLLAGGATSILQLGTNLRVPPPLRAELGSRLLEVNRLLYAGALRAARHSTPSEPHLIGSRHV
jgi:maleate isomerase